MRFYDQRFQSKQKKLFENFRFDLRKHLSGLTKKICPLEKFDCLFYRQVKLC